MLHSHHLAFTARFNTHTLIESGDFPGIMQLTHRDKYTKQWNILFSSLANPETIVGNSADLAFLVSESGGEHVYSAGGITSDDTATVCRL